MHKNITNLCSNEFEPVIRPEISVINIDNKNVVAVKVDMLNARNKPCYYKPKGLHNGSYTRVGDRDDNMTEYEIYKCISYRENVGNLYGSNTLELLQTRKAMEVRNETIVKLLETLGGIIENRHTGITTMQKAMKTANLPKPIFSNEREDFVVNFYNGEYPELYPEELNEFKKIQDKKTQDKKTVIFNKIIEICE